MGFGFPRDHVLPDFRGMENPLALERIVRRAEARATWDLTMKEHSAAERTLQYINDDILKIASANSVEIAGLLKAYCTIVGENFCEYRDISVNKDSVTLNYYHKTWDRPKISGGIGVPYECLCSFAAQDLFLKETRNKIIARKRAEIAALEKQNESST